MIEHTHTVSVDENGCRADQVLAARLQELSRTRIRSLIENGFLAVEQRTITKAGYRVKQGECLVLCVPPPRPAEPEAQARELDILFEDANLLVLNKPAGLVVHPAAGNPDGTLVNALVAHCGDSLSGIGGVTRPGIVHRLDKDTSGLMVVAKTDRTHVALSAALSRRDIRREYLAFAHGVPNPASGEISAPIGRSRQNRKKLAVVAHGKPALTRYTVARNWGTVASLLRCTLATGRTHQIRVHLEHIGHPVIGDRVYAGSGSRHASRRLFDTRELSRPSRQALHAVMLGFTHPMTGESHRFHAVLPEDLQDLTQALDNTVLT